jgi:hypothetical protein
MRSSKITREPVTFTGSASRMPFWVSFLSIPSGRSIPRNHPLNATPHKNLLQTPHSLCRIIVRAVERFAASPQWIGQRLAGYGVFGNWRSWWQTPDGFRRVADSASATSAPGRVHGSLPIFGVNARDPMAAPALHSVWPSGRRWIYTTASGEDLSFMAVDGGKDRGRPRPGRDGHALQPNPTTLSVCLSAGTP